MPKKKQKKDLIDTKVFGIRLRPHEREKYENFLEKTPFKTMADFVREAMNTYMTHPEIRDPTVGDASADQVLEGLTKFYERKQHEEEIFLGAINKNRLRLDVLERKIDLLLRHSKISEKDIKEAQGNDISEELIFDGDE
jgi:hypothetical protein